MAVLHRKEIKALFFVARLSPRHSAPRLRPSSLGGSPAESRPASATDSSDAAPYLSTPYDPAPPYPNRPFAYLSLDAKSSSAADARFRASRVSYLEKSFSSAPLCRGQHVARVDLSRGARAEGEQVSASGGGRTGEEEQSEPSSACARLARCEPQRGWRLMVLLDSESLGSRGAMW